MSNSWVFSEALDANGNWRNVDDVPRGLSCNCFCPHCHERVKACQGPNTDKRSHGFTHHSKKRGANLKICYYVSMYKRAESIIKEEGHIHAPSYYGIFREKDIKFRKDSIQIDSRYEREDKQPDIIATTEDGDQYLIEFVFKYKVQHKKPIDYKHLTCLEIDLSKQNFESLKDFLLESVEDRRWLNNEADFNRIEETYRKANKSVRVVCEKECEQCELKNQCVAARNKGSQTPLKIENSGESFRLCKTEEFKKLLEQKRHEEIEEKEKERKRLEEEQRNIERFSKVVPRPEVKELKEGPIKTCYDSIKIHETFQLYTGGETTVVNKFLSYSREKILVLHADTPWGKSKQPFHVSMIMYKDGQQVCEHICRYDSISDAEYRIIMLKKDI